MATMKAWQYQAASGPMEQNLFLPSAGIPLPLIKEDEVLVENYSTAVNPIDYKITELPLIPRLLFRSPITFGLDICGRIIQVGSQVQNFRVDDIVYGAVAPAVKHGGLAQFVPISHKAIALVPEGLKADDMVSIASAGATVYAGLKPYFKPGDRVFINGGSGGTGVAAIQIAKTLGYHVTTSCSTSNIELVKSLGADTVLDYTAAGIVDQLKDLGVQFDLILDNVGAPADLYKVSDTFLRPNGKFVQVGLGLSLSGAFQFITNSLYSFFRWGKRQYVFVDGKMETAVFEQLATWMKEGELHAVVDSTFEFGDTPKAYERLRTGRARGKVVVRVKE
jgi:NADPH:quinone reductase-like Zn-dependent oxidoreductase